MSSKEPREFKIAYLHQIKSGALKGTYLSWDGSPSTAYVKYIEFSAIESRDKQIAILDAALYAANEFTSSILEDMQHYFENKCCPTADEVNQCASADSHIRLALAEVAKLKEGK